MSRPGWIVCLWALTILSLAAPLALMAAKPPQLPLEFNDKVGEPVNQVAAGTEPVEPEIETELPSPDRKFGAVMTMEEIICLKAYGPNGCAADCAAKCPL